MRINIRCLLLITAVFLNCRSTEDVSFVGHDIVQYNKISSQSPKTTTSCNTQELVPQEVISTSCNTQELVPQEVISASNPMTHNDNITYFIEYEPESTTLTQDSVHSMAEVIGEQYGISPILLQAIARVESQYATDLTNSSGAVGICQVVPKYNKDRMDRLGITDLKNPYYNMVLCAEYIKDMRTLSPYGNDQNFIIMSYHAGINGATSKYEKNMSTDYVTSVNQTIKELEEMYL